ncbi:hypothetical protein DFH28DRAFT_1078751 [Melampsora americana]|nr:hypothetical protein DFH28DRAFT_1078751 [Melampsora americana]
MPVSKPSSTPTAASDSAITTSPSEYQDVERAASVDSVQAVKHVQHQAPAGAVAAVPDVLHELSNGVLNLFSNEHDSHQESVDIAEADSNHLKIGYNITRPIDQLRPDFPAMHFGFMYCVMFDRHTNIQLTYDPERIRGCGYTETLVTYKIGTPITLSSSRDMSDWAENDIYIEWETLPKKLTTKHHHHWASPDIKARYLARSKANFYVTNMLWHYQDCLCIMWTTHGKPKSKEALKLKSIHNKSKLLHVPNMYLLQSLVETSAGSNAWYMCESQHDSTPNRYKVTAKLGKTTFTLSFITPIMKVMPLITQSTC